MTHLLTEDEARIVARILYAADQRHAARVAVERLCDGLDVVAGQPTSQLQPAPKGGGDEADPVYRTCPVNR